ncbi:sulfatase-like hydrolase/transferase [Pseudoxanthobacter sp.]|uniref:sulfatase-like hydrolase/transferase n=1 Tax=Pseudoxanthobacter sp. TaxID=1925742 RepID=UPI002FE21543
MRPNLLLITADQWRGDSLGAAGHAVVQTPALDGLARRGVRFARHYAGAVPCSPARACLYTGLYQMTNRVVRNGTPLDARHDTLAKMLRRGGYDPTLFGYTDQTVDPRTAEGDDPRLRTYEGILPGFTVRMRLPEDAAPWLAWLQRRGVAVPARGADIWLPAGGGGPEPGRAAPVYGADDTETAFLTDLFLDWLEEQRFSDRPADHKPWCAHLSFIRPHPPFVVPAPFNTLYDAAAGPAFARAATAEQDAAVHPLVAMVLQTATRGHFLPGAGAGLVSSWSDAAFRTIRALYWGMISEVDRQIGRVLAGLEAAGMAGNTVIMFSADHGEMMGDHWSLGKYGYFDGSYHIPLIVADPRRPEAHGTGVEAFTEAVDVMPTLAALAGLRAPGHLDGQSLLPFLDGAAAVPGWREEAHFEFDFRDVAGGRSHRLTGVGLDEASLAVLRGRRFKYVAFAGLKPLLFDLEADPAETADVAGDPAFRAVRLEMAEKMLAWRARHLDRCLTGLEMTAAGVVDARA